MAGEVATDIDAGLGVNDSGSNSFMGFLQDIFSNPQKRLIAIISAVVLVGLIVFLIFSAQQKGDENRGDLVPLVQEIDQARAFEIVAKLKSFNIEAKINPSEKPGEYVVMVYENAVESSYLTLSRTNLLEGDDYGLFDVNDWAASDYDKRIKLTRAINGDLSKIISRLDGLRAAIVRINIPEQQIFTDLQAPTTATVQIELLNDAEELTKAQVKSIVNVLRGYVPNLEKERISIVDTQGRSYSTFKDENEADADDFIDETQKLNKIMEDKIAKYLDAILGPELYKVSVNVAVSREKVEQQQTIYSDGAVGSRQTGSETLKSGGSGGAGPGGGAGKDYNSSSTNETLMPSYEQKNVTYLPGRITEVSVALAVDKSVPTMISLQQLQESVAAIVGYGEHPERIKLTVVDLQSKNVEAQQTAQKPGFVQIVQNFFKGGVWSVVTKIFTIIGIVLGLLFVGVIGLNFLSAAANKNYSADIDPNLATEFDQSLGNEYLTDQSYGEDKVLEQQEALLREMMGQNQISQNEIPKSSATSYSNFQQEQKPADDQLQFDNLLNNFQSVANSKPDLLAKKIQMWLDED
jgi:flagellar biosynthesis/type III secretory pathway M-ring protein FliF/YscJ